jgi:hypothetical protein
LLDLPQCNRTAEDGACVFQMAAGAKYSLNSHQRGVAFFKETSMIATQKQVLYNATAAAAHFDYIDPMTKQRHQCWYEDEVTHRAKVQMLRQDFPELQGMALFTTNVDYFEPLYRAGRFMQFGVSWERPAHMLWQQAMWAAAASFSDGGQISVEPRLKIDGDDSSYVPLPPVPPFPTLPVLALPELNRGQVLQLWGHSQAVALRDTAVPAKMKAAYAFDMVTMLPRNAHNSMSNSKSDHQQGSKADVLTEAEFAAGVEAFAKAGFSVIFYTSIMHDGHRADWESGSITKTRPELLQRDEHDGCPSLYGSCNLSPSSATTLTLDHTIADAALFPKVVKAVVIDNAFWQTGPSGPAGFESAAVARFKSYMAQRFGKKTAQFFGKDVIAPPTETQRNSTDANHRALFNMWKIWRETEYAHATETYRQRLHPLGVAVLANTDFWPESWTRGDCELLGHVDAVVSESHVSSAATMAEKYSLGLGLTPGRPNLNYIAVFSQACQSHYSGDNATCPMKTQEAMRGMVVPAFAAMSRPWLVAWSLSP